MLWQSNTTFEGRLVDQNAILRLGVYVLTLMRKRESDVIWNLVLLPQLGQSIQGAYRVGDYPPVMKKGERAGLDPD